MNLRRSLLTPCLLVFFSSVSVFLNAQKSTDPVLFEVADREITVSEFTHIYEKTNTGNADYSKQSIREYLELYANFKLKVQKAYDLGLDTLPELKNELEGYKRQLANTYLMDRAVVDKLVDEAFERFQFDVSISHIFIPLPEDRMDADTLEVYNKAMSVYNRIPGYESFSAAAAAMSEDHGTAHNGGRIGHITALLYPATYNLETAAYQTPIGEYSKPVRTHMGYHIVKVNEKRPAIGEREVAHVFVPIRGASLDEVQKSKTIINQAYAELEEGTSFDRVALHYSEDNENKTRGGFLGKITVNQYDSIFESHAFALQNAGDYSKPFRTRNGFHIVMLVNDYGVLHVERDRNAVLNRIKRDERFHIAQRSLLRQIERESGYQTNRESFDQLATGLNESFLSRDWKPEESQRNLPWLEMDGAKYNLSHFTEYLQNQQQFRTRRSRNIDLTHLLQQMYDSYRQQLLFSWEEDRLEEKYPDFKALMREYNEGVLLFEITRRKIWDRAAQDTADLVAFFSENRERYPWEERAKIQIYRLNTTNQSYALEIRNAAASMSNEELLKKYNDDVELIHIVPRTVEKSRFENYDDTPWKAGTLSRVYQESGRLHFIRIDEIKTAGSRSFEEARGYVMADYQDKLEQEWIQNLRAEYPVIIHQEVLNGLIIK